MRLEWAVAAVLIGTAPAHGQTPFALTAVVYPKSHPDHVFVSTSGDPPDIVALTRLGSWKLIAKAGKADRIPVTVQRVDWSAGSQTATLTFDRRSLGGTDPANVSWIVMRPDEGLTAASESPPDTGLQAAKGKDDADIYLFGSFLAGVSTKPIYTLDAKLHWGKDLRKGWSWGVDASILANGDAKPPADRTRIDPDSIKGSFGFTRVQSFDRGWWTGMIYDLMPAQGEFTRKYPLSNFVPAAYARFTTRPQPLGRAWVAFYPQLGFEGGTNLNRPGVLFNQPVDLSGYRGIARLFYAGLAEWYIMTAHPGGDDVYRFTLEAKAQARTPLTLEPYVTTEYVNGQRATITRLRKNTRPEVEVAANYAFTKLFGVKAQYLYGSLPPLFQFTDHQVTVGFTFKAKRP